MINLSNAQKVSLGMWDAEKLQLKEGAWTSLEDLLLALARRERWKEAREVLKELEDRCIRI